MKSWSNYSPLGAQCFQPALGWKTLWKTKERVATARSLDGLRTQG